MKRRCMILIAGLTALCMGCGGEADKLSENEIREEQTGTDNAENEAEPETATTNPSIEIENEANLESLIPETELDPLEESVPAVEEDNSLQAPPVLDEETEPETKDEELLTVNGYVMKTNNEKTMMYLDTVNPGGRVFPDEGKDRMVAFDITNAELNILELSYLSKELAQTIQAKTVCTGLSVYVEYYEKDGNNIATYIETTGIEEGVRAVEAIVEGTVLSITGNILYVDVTQDITWGNPDEIALGETEMDITYVKKMPENLEPGMEITAVYYYDAYGESESNIVTEIYINE